MFTRKFIISVVSICIIALSVTVPALADIDFGDYTAESDFSSASNKNFTFQYYPLQGDETTVPDKWNFVNIIKYLGSKKIVSIPKNIFIDEKNGTRPVRQVNLRWTKGVTKVKVPNNIEILGISESPNLKCISILKSNKDYVVKDGKYLMKRNGNKKCTYLLGVVGGVKKVVMPNSTVEFHGVGKKAVSIKLGKNVKTIPDNAFLSHVRLKKCTLNKNLKSIGKDAFYGCNKLKKILIPNGLRKIGSGAFGGCIALKKFVCPKSVTEIGAKAFTSCYNLKTITIKNAKCKISTENDIKGNNQNITIPSRITIHAPKGSYAQKYAKKHGNKFIPL